jgi:hypothetical protein
MPDLQSLGDLSIHLFSFGGPVQTARWAMKHRVKTGFLSPRPDATGALCKIQP